MLVLRTCVRARQVLGCMVPRPTSSSMRMFDGEVICIYPIDGEMPEKTVNVNK